MLGTLQKYWALYQHTHPETQKLLHAIMNCDFAKSYEVVVLFLCRLITLSCLQKHMEKPFTGGSMTAMQKERLEVLFTLSNIYPSIFNKKQPQEVRRFWNVCLLLSFCRCN